MSDILCRHYHDEPLVRSRLDDFRSLMDVADLTGPVLDGAFSFDGPDLEGGIVRATAELLGAEAIVMRDSSACRGSSVPATDARAYCECVGWAVWRPWVLLIFWRGGELLTGEPSRGFLRPRGAGLKSPNLASWSRLLRP